MNDEKYTMMSSSDRLKSVRKMLRLTRKYLEETYSMPAVTLKAWENGMINLSNAGAERCVEIYRKEGVLLTLDWLMTGDGSSPKFLLDLKNYFSEPCEPTLEPEEDEEFCIAKDVNSFKKNNKNSVAIIVTNNDMLPFYPPYVRENLFV